MRPVPPTLLVATLVLGSLAVRPRIVSAQTPAATAGSIPTEQLVRLGGAFIPDPRTLSVRAGGQRDLHQLSPECVGFGPLTAGVVLDVSERIGFLRIYATGPIDLVLAVQSPDGTVQCNDDRFGTSPAVELTFAQGRYSVYVGVKEQGRTEVATLALTETRTVRPGTAETEGAALTELGLTTDASTGRFDSIRLRRGFLPDPRVLAGSSGGTIALVERDDGCIGTTEQAPSHVVELIDNFRFLEWTVRTSIAGSGTTFMVLAPNGSVFCSSATTLRFFGAARGQYRVWVLGRAAAVVPYEFSISEVRRSSQAVRVPDEVLRPPRTSSP